jgi:hypothetical protein
VDFDVEGRRMKRMIAVLVLLVIAAGCGSTKRRAIQPGPHPTEEQKYLAGFMDGYRGAHPLDPHLRDRPVPSDASSYNQGVRDGYLTGRKDEMQRR